LDNSGKEFRLTCDCDGKYLYTFLDGISSTIVHSYFYILEGTLLSEDTLHHAEEGCGTPLFGGAIRYTAYLFRMIRGRKIRVWYTSYDLHLQEWFQ
jgi:hypothetical protein